MRKFIPNVIQESAFDKAGAQNFDQAKPAQKLLPIINRGRFLRINRYIPFLKNKLILLILLFATPSLMAESTDDSIYAPPPPIKTSTWKASAFAGCALLAVVGGVFAIFWSGGSSTHHKHHKDCADSHPGRRRDDVCPNTITADCMAGSCIYHPATHESDCHHKEKSCHAPCEIINNPPPCCALNGGVPPF